jgi:hypothetical protein
MIYMIYRMEGRWTMDDGEGTLPAWEACVAPIGISPAMAKHREIV